MVTTRRIKKILQSTPIIEGAGVRLKRAFGFHQVPQLDPFLLFDDFHSARPDDYRAGFPWHPHRGIETITYMLAGEVEHGDSLGNRGVIRAGDLQWMTAGSGVIHQEMPRGGSDDVLWGFQLWANLPASHKMMDPRYREIRSSRIPVVKTAEGARVKVICGEVNGVEGPVKGIVTDPRYLDVTVPGGASFSFPIDTGHTAAAYVVEGKGSFDPAGSAGEYVIEGARYFDFEREDPITPENLVIFGDGDRIVVDGGGDGVRFLLFSGRPLREPIAWYGPIVMNTREELNSAFEEYRNGTFIRQKSELSLKSAGR
jgi:redox-sensitive bicupin YhaK (pirin superfamily)